MKRDKLLFLIFHIFVIAFVLFLKVAVHFENIKSDMKFLEVLLMFVYIYVFLTAKVYLDWLNSYMIFLYTTFLFNFTRIFLDVVNYREFGWATKFANFYFYYDVRIEIITIFLLVLLFTHLGFFIGIMNEEIYELKSSVTLQKNPIFENLGMFLFIISLPALAYKMLLQLKVILSAG